MDDLGQFGLGAGRLHPVGHAAQQLDHLAPFAQHLTAAQKLVVHPLQLTFAAPLVIGSRGEALHHVVIAVGQTVELARAHAPDNALLQIAAAQTGHGPRDDPNRLADAADDHEGH